MFAKIWLSSSHQVFWWKNVISATSICHVFLNSAFFVKSKLLCFFIAFMESQWLFLILYSLHLCIPSECKMNNPNLQGITILCLKWPQCYQLWPFYSSSIRFKTPKRVKFEYWRFWPAIFGKLTFFNNLWLLNIWWGW